MQTTFCSRRARQIACLAAISSALLLAGRYLWADQTEPRTVEEKTYSATPAFGPGGRIAANSVEPLNQVNAVIPDDVAAASFATDDRELVINAGLLQVFDYFLRQASGANRENSSHALRMFLQERLTTASVTNALQIADNYRSYMTQHDGLLAAQNLDHRAVNLSTADAGRIKTWMQLRLLLRQSVLGDTVTLAWYDNDDAQLNHVLEELPQAATFDDATQHRMQEVLDKAGTRFSGLADRGF